MVDDFVDSGRPPSRSGSLSLQRPDSLPSLPPVRPRIRRFGILRRRLHAAASEARASQATARFRAAPSTPRGKHAGSIAAPAPGRQSRPGQAMLRRGGIVRWGRASLAPRRRQCQPLKPAPCRASSGPSAPAPGRHPKCGRLCRRAPGPKARPLRGGAAWGGLGGPAPARASGAGRKHQAMVCHRRPGGHHMLEAGIPKTRSARRGPRYNQRRERNCSALEGSCPMTAGGPNRPLFLRLGPPLFGPQCRACAGPRLALPCRPSPCPAKPGPCPARPRAKPLSLGPPGSRHALKRSARSAPPAIGPWPQRR